MESKAKLAGYPAHPIRVVVPLGLLTTPVIGDGSDLHHNVLGMALVAYWMVVGGLVSGLVAVVIGWIDRFIGPIDIQASQIGLLQDAGNVLLLTPLWRSHEPVYQPHGH